MTKDKKKKKEKKVKPKLTYSLDRIREVAKSVITVNPAMVDRSVDAMTRTIENSILRAHAENSWFIASGGWFALLDDWDDEVFVDFYISADLVSDYLMKL